MKREIFYVYILTNKAKTVLYIGVTNNLARRLVEHKKSAISGFTEKYHTHHLVYVETCESIVGAITREKQLKKWNRAWKERLINEMNSDWKDLSEEYF